MEEEYQGPSSASREARIMYQRSLSDEIPIETEKGVMRVEAINREIFKWASHNATRDVNIMPMSDMSAKINEYLQHAKTNYSEDGYYQISEALATFNSTILQLVTTNDSVNETGKNPKDSIFKIIAQPKSTRAVQMDNEKEGLMKSLFGKQED